MNSRKIIQIVAMPDGIVALCEDGSLWYKTISETAVMGVWQEIDAIPA